MNNSFFLVKKGIVLHEHWGILTKVFSKTLKIHTNLWEMGIRCPF